jgi:hypothetical protein
MYPNLREELLELFTFLGFVIEDKSRQGQFPTALEIALKKRREGNKMSEVNKLKKGAMLLGEFILNALKTHGIVKDGEKEYLDFQMNTAEFGVCNIIFKLSIKSKPLVLMQVHVGRTKVIRVFPALYGLDRHLCEELSCIAEALGFAYSEIEELDCGQLRRALSGEFDKE